MKLIYFIFYPIDYVWIQIIELYSHFYQIDLNSNKFHKVETYLNYPD
jgi:hypothetical protein